MTTDPKHNSVGGSIPADQLRAYVRKLERLDDEVATLQAQKGELLAEAKSCGFCKRTIRKLLARRRNRGTGDEEDALLETYDAAVWDPSEE